MISSLKCQMDKGLKLPRTYKSYKKWKKCEIKKNENKNSL